MACKHDRTQSLDQTRCSCSLQWLHTAVHQFRHSPCRQSARPADEDVLSRCANVQQGFNGLGMQVFGLGSTLPGKAQLWKIGGRWYTVTSRVKSCTALVFRNPMSQAEPFRAAVVVVAMCGDAAELVKIVSCGLPGRCGGAARSCELLTKAQSVSCRQWWWWRRAGMLRSSPSRCGPRAAWMPWWRCRRRGRRNGRPSWLPSWLHVACRCRRPSCR